MEAKKIPSSPLRTMPSGTVGDAWLVGRLDRRARDARQAEMSAAKMFVGGYPCASALAEAHRKAAEVYEAALAAARNGEL